MIRKDKAVGKSQEHGLGQGDRGLDLSIMFEKRSEIKQTRTNIPLRDRCSLRLTIMCSALIP